MFESERWSPSEIRRVRSLEPGSIASQGIAFQMDTCLKSTNYDDDDNVSAYLLSCFFLRLGQAQRGELIMQLNFVGGIATELMMG